MKRISHTGRQIRDLIEMINASVERTEVFVEVCENLEKAIGFSGAVMIPHQPTNAAATFSCMARRRKSPSRTGKA